MMRSNTVCFIDFPLYSGSHRECIEAMTEAALNQARECKLVACLNPHSYVLARNDEFFHKALVEVDWLLPDGIGVVWTARLLHLSIGGRLTGPDTFISMLSELNKCGASVFFLGSTDEVLNRIRIRLSEEYPNLVIAGTFSPSFDHVSSTAEDEVICSKINKVKPDVLWVGMTAPKQEKWLAQNRDRLQVGLAGSVGAAFDFYAGTVKRSPKIFRAIGLEWLPRLIQQPGRLWRRIFVSTPVFFYDFCKYFLKTKVFRIK